MKKVIVTGANGFVGSAVCCELSKRGIEIIAVVKDEMANLAAIMDLPGVRLVYCELSQYCSLPDKIPDRDVDALFHFAWLGNAGSSRGNDRVQLSNVQATCDLVRACGALGCNRFVFASSIMGYEVMAQMEKNLIPSINTLYSTAKLTADYMAAAIAASLGITYIRAVISNIYGPGETSPRLINSSLRKLIRGEHCSFSSGEQQYDFIYIADAALALIALGEKGFGNKMYYIGSLNPQPLKAFLLEMRDQVDPSIPIGLGELPSDTLSCPYDKLDLEAVKRDTGVVPQTSFAEGIKKTLDWIKRQEA